MASAKSVVFPISFVHSEHSPIFLPKVSSSHSNLWGVFRINSPYSLNRKNRFGNLINAVYTERISAPKLSASEKKKKVEEDQDGILMLNERIRRDHSKRDSGDAPRSAMDPEEAEKYIRMVRVQQQRGLQKLKGNREVGHEGAVNYRVDPYTLRSGDYVVHKRVGIGRFVGIKFDVPKDSTRPVEYVFIEYADGMAKLPVKQAFRMLYRYNL